jgi:hypothetical protein
VAGSTLTSDRVAKVVFVPTTLAYGWLVVGYVRSGLVLFSVFMVGAHLMGLFRRITEWPVISKIALACGPTLIVLGCYFSTLKTAYAMLIPGAIYCVLSIAGGLALRRVR